MGVGWLNGMWYLLCAVLCCAEMFLLLVVDDGGLLCGTGLAVESLIVCLCVTGICGLMNVYWRYWMRELRCWVGRLLGYVYVPISYVGESGLFWLVGRYP
jgi:hypothetical protein